MSKKLFRECCGKKIGECTCYTWGIMFLLVLILNSICALALAIKITQ